MPFSTSGNATKVHNIPQAQDKSNGGPVPSKPMRSHGFFLDISHPKWLGIPDDSGWPFRSSPWTSSFDSPQISRRIAEPQKSPGKLSDLMWNWDGFSMMIYPLVNVYIFYIANWKITIFNEIMSKSSINGSSSIANCLFNGGWLRATSYQQQGWVGWISRWMVVGFPTG